MAGFSRKQAVPILKKIPLFAGLRDDEYEVLVDVCQVRQFKPGEMLFREGDVGTELYVVLRGSVEVATAAAGVLNTLEPGEVLGEVAVVSHVRRTASATASADTALLGIGWDALDRLVGKAPRASYLIMRNIAQALAERLMRANTLLARG